MEMIKEDIPSKIIKEIRTAIYDDEKEIRDLVGIRKTDIANSLPIRNNIGGRRVLLNDESSPVAVLTYELSVDEAFVKMLYVIPDFRCMGFASELLSEFCEEHGSVSMQINKVNEKMYALVEKLGFTGEVSNRLKMLGVNSKPKWWSNKESN